MNTLLLYDNGVNWLSLLTENLNPHLQVETILSDCEELKACTGCFGCWIKTPGKCVINNDPANHISKKFMQADFVIILTRICYGGYSPDIKAFLDRSICNLSPLFSIIDGEMHHQKRYPQYPDIIAVGYGDFTDEERETFSQLLKKMP